MRAFLRVFWRRSAMLAILGVSATGGAASGQQWTAEAMKGVDQVLQGQTVEAPPRFDFRAAVAEIRAAERLVNAAVQTGDSAELRSIERELIRLEARVMEAKPGDNRASCGLAAGDLAAIGSSMRRMTEQDAPARHLVAAQTLEAAYRRHIAECDRALRASERRARR